MKRRAFVGSLSGAAIAAPATVKRIIDSHTHVWKTDPRFPFAPGVKPNPADATAEMLLDLMKQNGVAHTVIIQVIHYRWDNSYLADVLKRYPKAFHGVARVNPEDPANADHLEKLVKEQRFRGVRLSPGGNASGDWIKGPLMPPLWKRCQSLRVPMTLLMPVTRCPDAANLIEQFPDLTVVVDHMADSPIGKPEELEKLTALARYPKVFVKISHTWSLSKQDYPWRDTHEQVKRLHQAFGPERLMWGTDWPVSAHRAQYAQTLSVVRDEMTFLNDKDREWILSKTVERVWPFK